MLLGGKDNIPEKSVTYTEVKPSNHIEIKGFGLVHDLLFSMFRLTLVDSYDFDVRACNSRLGAVKRVFNHRLLREFSLLTPVLTWHPMG